MEGPHDSPFRILRDEMEALQLIDAGAYGRVTDTPCAHPTLNLREAEGAFVHSGRFAYDGLDFMKRLEPGVRSVYAMWRLDHRRGHDCRVTNMSSYILVAFAGKGECVTGREVIACPGP